MATAKKQATKVVQAEQAQAPVVIDQAATMLDIISRASTDPNVDIDKMERLMQMHERIMQNQGIEKFNQSMNQAQAEMRPISTDAENPQTRSKYASYGQLDRALRPIYTKHGFSISYDTGESKFPEHILVLAYVANGTYSKTYRVDMPTDGKGAKGNAVMTKTHASGSAMTYGMRYLLKMIFNVAIGEDDNDGNGEAAPVQFINDEQQATLQDLLSQLPAADKVPFLQMCQAKTLSEIRVSQYEMAKQRIKDRIAAQGAAA